MKRKGQMFGVLLLVAMMFPGFCFAEDVNISNVGVYSTGYRMGMLSKFSPDKGWISSGEGQMLMGSESSPYIQKISDGNKGKTIEKMINPWYFSSADKKMIKKLTEYTGQYVVLEYVQGRVKSPKVDTEYEITGISEITPPLTESCYAVSYNKGMRSEDAVRTGRIVKASTKGTLAKSWEILMQQGESGNQFKSMSISDDVNLFNCAVAFLKAGQKVKITYSESFTNVSGMFDRDTNIDIVSIEPLVVGQKLN